jgi:transposase
MRGKASFVYVRDRKGNKIASSKITTDKEGIGNFFKEYDGKKLEVAIEAGGSTRWIYDYLRWLGMDVYVVNPNKVKAIADSKRKTDKIDAKILSELLRIDALPQKVHMAEGKNRELRDLIQARHQVIKGYTNLMNYLRGLLRQEGIHVKAREFTSANYETRLKEESLPKHVQKIIATYAVTIKAMIEEKKKLEDSIKKYQTRDIELIKTIPGMGDISSRTIQAAIGDIKRFNRAKQLTSYCGLVPSVRQSGERTEYGHITREGRSEVRRVGIQCAHALLHSKAKESQPLQEWWRKIAERRGAKTAMVALARKLITITFYVLRDQKAYDHTLLKTA